jgi:hypothetical protein
MKTMTPISAPADILGLGGSAVRGCAGLDSRIAIGDSPAPHVAPVQWSGVSTGGTAVRQRLVFQAVRLEAGQTSFAHNSIDGTTLGIHPSGRPLS